jgi:Propionate catabolism activator.
MIVFIAPYSKLKEIADSLADRYTEPMRSVVGDLGAGLALARQALDEDAILVSRGGTAKLIRESLGVDVIEIGVSYLDLMRILKPYMGSHKPIAVAGFRALINYAKNVCEALGIKAEYLPVDDEAEMPSRIEQVRGMNVACLVGDMVAVRSAKDLGIPLALIESGLDAVAEALDKAAMVVRSLMARRAGGIEAGRRAQHCTRRYRSGGPVGAHHPY